MDKKNLIIAVVVVGVIAALALALTRKGKTGEDSRLPAGAAHVPKQEVAALYQEAVTLKDKGDLVKAKEVYRQILTEHSDYEKIEAVQSDLENVNMRLVFSNIPTAQSVVHEVAAGDTLGKIAKQYATTVDLIKINNNLRGDTIRLGQKLRIWTGKFNVYVDKSQNVLMLKDGEEVLKIYHVSTGANNSTPVGTFKVTSKLIDPVWFNKGVVVPPDSPQNVLGSRWLGFDIPGYGIHGTIEPDTIGQQVTAGCVRMLNRDVEELYSLLPMGTEVVIVD